MNLHLGDCMDVLRTLPSDSVDSIVTDPPYGLSFMGKKWDYDVPTADVWAECLRVLKPGGHLLAFAGTRTQHRMAVRIEDAGFEIRDMIAWVYGSGFPKSMDVSKAIDKAAGAERQVVGSNPNHRASAPQNQSGADREWFQDRSSGLLTVPATDAARQWQGWGTALKPALEPITVARKPLIGTVAANVLEHGTGALNIDGCRVGWPDGKAPEIGSPGWGGPAKKLTAAPGQDGASVARSAPSDLGRWPANLIHDGSDEVVALFPAQAGGAAPPSLTGSDSTAHAYGDYAKRSPVFHGDKGSAARFFYCAKTSKRDRGDGNAHPTVKPTDLMAYLCRLVTPPGGVVLDPFMGSGSTGKAAVREGFQFIGIERDEGYFKIAEARLEKELYGDLV